MHTVMFSIMTLWRAVHSDPTADGAPEGVEFSGTCAPCASQLRFDASDRVVRAEPRDEFLDRATERALQHTLVRRRGREIGSGHLLAKAFGRAMVIGHTERKSMAESLLSAEGDQRNRCAYGEYYPASEGVTHMGGDRHGLRERL
jgi:hypothetical protein